MENATARNFLFIVKLVRKLIHSNFISCGNILLGTIASALIGALSGLISADNKFLISLQEWVRVSVLDLK